MVTVLLEDQTLRDGLQNEPRLLSLAEKLEIARLLAAAGVRRLQVGSFVDPRRVPQMAGTEELVALVRRELPGVECTALALNERGLQRALGCGLRRLSLSVSLADSHSRLNAGCGASEALSRVRQGWWVGPGTRAWWSGPGCSAPLAATANRWTGRGWWRRRGSWSGPALWRSTWPTPRAWPGPDEVARLVGRVRQTVVAVPLSLHLHGSRQRTRANLLAGYRAGVRLFDVAVGGLGGCPFAPGAGGNVATEEAAGLFASIRVATGLDVPALAAAARRIAQLLGRPLRPPESPGSG